MPRRPSVRYFPSRGGFYCQHQGRQHLLAKGEDDFPDGPVYKEALAAFNAIMFGTEKPRPGGRISVAAVITRHYQALEKKGSTSTLDLHRRLLDPAVLELGNLDARELHEGHVFDWLSRQEKWGDATKRTAIEVLTWALNRCRRSRLLPFNPLEEMKDRPERRSRGEDFVLPPAVMDALEVEASPALAKLLRFLRVTGCRPGEVMHAAFDRYRPDVPAIVHPMNPLPGTFRWKNARKTKRDRVVYLTPELQAMVEAEAAARGRHGLILLTPRGKPWTRDNLYRLMTRLVKKPAVVAACAAHLPRPFDPDKIVPYAYRHTYATEMLKRKCPIKVLADLMGTSVAMIDRVYGHAHDDLAAMHRLFMEFAPGAGASGRSPS